MEENYIIPVQNIVIQLCVVKQMKIEIKHN